MRRFFIEDIKGDSVEIKGAEFSRLKNVLRFKAGDELVVFDGKGHEFKAKIEKIGKHSGSLKLEEKLMPIAESPLHITLICGLPKGDKPEFITEKATELGVKKIIFYTGTRTVPRLDAEKSEKKLLRLKKASIEALKQCGRAYPPTVAIMNFNDAVKGHEEKLKIVFYEREKNGRLKGILKGKSVAAIVGCEGGLDEEDVILAKEQGFIPVSLGPRILRVETAVAAVISILQHNLGDMQ